MCFGTLKRLCHFGPLTALGIIKSISFMAVHCCSMWWPPSASLGGSLNVGCFLIFSALTIYNFLSSIYEGPGFLPVGWKPKDEEDAEFLQYCGVCEGYKAPRAHHCRKCGRCVLKMDHHCPWINNCVGHRNHAHFAAFLLFATCGCFHAAIIFSCSLIRAFNRDWYLYYGNPEEPIVSMTAYTLVFCLFCLGLSIGVAVVVGMLFCFQLRSIWRNQTGIEDWIVEKAHHRRRGDESNKFIFPYNLGWRKNFSQVINLSCDPVGDGIVWPVLDGCDQYVLTREQIEQKQEKRERTRRYLAMEDYSGSWFPISKGLSVCCRPPLTDEPRIRITKGDTILVTRWKVHWLFGEKEGEALVDGLGDGQRKGGSRVRGWFPRRCVVEVINGSMRSVVRGSSTPLPVPCENHSRDNSDKKDN
ncbi:palmitoyltransferase ZDHHC6 [Ischnura elegans]|uniref:palmitoyltransferase ZDHHC6 n=1 Tax=Ischnura elegans TaxID=197161 RepID=UPI001ED88D72|nr:palmitoyltransferase ZDHHC6 [Ischnura elegans]